MRRLAYLSLALSSAVVAGAETRPHYGGTLRVQLIGMFPSPEAVPLVAETLVRFDEHGDLVPLLARGWQPDTEKKRWRFIIRSKVGTPAAGGHQPAFHSGRDARLDLDAARPDRIEPHQPGGGLARCAVDVDRSGSHRERTDAAPRRNRAGIAAAMAHRLRVRVQRTIGRGTGARSR